MLDLSNLDIAEQLREIERCEAEDSLYVFLRAAWLVAKIDPAKWTDGWPMEAVCEHLAAVVDGDIRNLIINIPPRCAKSSLCSVAFPAWVWAQEHQSPTSGPGVPLLHASYASKLALRDSVKCRRLIQSPWYQSLWGKRFQISSDQNVKSRFTNDKGGERLITSVDAGVTGEGGNIICIDDPNAANEAFSEATIQTTIDWWTQTMSTRSNDAKTGAYIVIQQRLAEDDLTGHILSTEDGDWTHLCLPMRYESDRSFMTPIGWTDPRGLDDNGDKLTGTALKAREGSLLWPDRFGEAEVKRLERILGPFGAAGQLQQRPEPQGGGIIKRAWWQLWDQEAFPAFDYVLAALDTAYTTKTTNDYSALTIWGVFTQGSEAVSTRAIGRDGRPTWNERSYTEKSPKIMLMSAWQDRLELHELVEKVAKSCKTMKVDKLLIENKAAGISVAQEIRRVYGWEDFGVQLYDPGAQDKVARLYSVQHLFAEGAIFAPDKDWAEMVMAQVGQFPTGKWDDLVDTCSMAVRHLRDLGLLTRSAERMEEVQESLRYQGREPPPLYPA